MTPRLLFRIVACCFIFLTFLEIATARQASPFYLSADYKSFYTAGYLARTDPQGLYDIAKQHRLQETVIAPGGMFLPFYHPAYEALLYIPLSLLRYQASYRLMLAVNVALAGLAVLALPGVHTLKIPLLQHYPALGLLLFAPVLVAVLQGQDSLLYLLLACMAWQCFHKQQNFTAGFVLALMLFRFQLTLPLLAILLVRRGLSLLPGFLLGLSVVAGACFWLVGSTGSKTFGHLLLSGSLGLNQGEAAQQAVGVHPLAMPNLRGLMYAIGSSHLTPSHLLTAVGFLSLVTLAWTGYLARRLAKDEQVFATALLCSMLVSYHMNPHDLSLALLPLALLRTQASLWTGAVLYAASLAIAFYFGAMNFYLLANPLMLLLLLTGWKRHEAPPEPAYSSTIVRPA